tara:strand:- start:945 stop:1349 length:405 start_codon:yes stop_codon:yes gene_type:complete
LKLRAAIIQYKTEAELQTAVVNYIKKRWPYVRYCASLGGQYQKHISQRKKAKATGYVAGFPDLQICAARGGYYGLFIEIKLHRNCYASQVQKDWIDDLLDRGYLAVLCKGYDECIETLENYFINDRTNEAKKNY